MSQVDSIQKPSQERLQKVLAKAGISSRRKAEVLILQGAVTVNGRRVTELGTKVDPDKDKIKVNGKLIYAEVEPLYIVYYKPKGVISALSDPEGRPHLGELQKILQTRVYPIGRLDFNTEGLILLTNDGTLAEKIFKNRAIKKTYLAKVKGHYEAKDIEELKKGFYTENGVVRFTSIKADQKLKQKTWLKLEVSEGSKLDLRELLNRKGFMVDRMIRESIGPLNISDLEPGEFKLVKRSDFQALALT